MTGGNSIYLNINKQTFYIVNYLFCVFFYPTEFSPVNIFSSKAEVARGEILEFRCVIFHKNEMQRNELDMYLCKNGKKYRKKKRATSTETNFELTDVRKEDSGNYSCMYSTYRHATQEETVVGQDSICILVKGNTSVINDIVINIVTIEGLQGCSI